MINMRLKELGLFGLEKRRQKEEMTTGFEYEGPFSGQWSTSFLLNEVNEDSNLTSMRKDFSAMQGRGGCK